MLHKSVPFSSIRCFDVRVMKRKGKRKEERGKRKEERGKRKEERGKRKEERGKRKEERGKRKEERGKEKKRKGKGKGKKKGKRIVQNSSKHTYRCHTRARTAEATRPYWGVPWCR